MTFAPVVDGIGGNIVNDMTERYGLDDGGFASTDPAERRWNPFGQNEIDELGRAVAAAPSVLNSQPWLMRSHPDGIDLFEDERAALESDPDGRERLISCGAAITNATIAMRQLGWHPDVRLRSNGATVGPSGPVDPPGPLAKIRRVDTFRPGSADQRQYSAIARRRTYRRVFGPGTVPIAVADELRQVASGHGCRLTIVTGIFARRTVAELMLRAAKSQAANTGFQAEIRRATHDSISDSDGRGIVHASLGMAPYPVDGLIHRAVSEDTDQDQVEAELRRSMVAVLFTDDDGPRDWLFAGMALQRVLLAATAGGLAVAMPQQIMENPATRSELAAELHDGGAPQMLLRIGWPLVTMPATPRRAVSEFLLPS